MIFRNRMVPGLTVLTLFLFLLNVAAFADQAAEQSKSAPRRRMLVPRMNVGMSVNSTPALSILVALIIFAVLVAVL